MTGSITHGILLSPHKAPFEVGVIPSITYLMSWIRKSKYLIQVCQDLPLFIPRCFDLSVLFCFELAFLVNMNLFYSFSH